MNRLMKVIGIQYFWPPSGANLISEYRLTYFALPYLELSIKTFLLINTIKNTGSIDAMVTSVIAIILSDYD